MHGKKYKKGFVSLQEILAYYNAIGKLGQMESLSEEGKNLYHYTSTNVLDAIFNSGTFRASNLFYLNDKIEYKMGIEILRGVFKEHEQILNYLKEIENFDGQSSGGVYSISYSNQSDALQQWITYAKEDGVCIELNGDIIWNKDVDDLYLGIKSDNNDIDIRVYKHCFLKLAYAKDKGSSSEDSPQLEAEKIKLFFAEAIKETKETKEEVLDEKKIIDIWEKHSDYAKHFLQLLAAYYKDERFKGEGEIRAAFLPVYKTKYFYSKISYFCQNNGILRPYIDIRFLHKYEGKYEVECPIKSIMVGPGGKQQSVFASIIHRLQHSMVKGWRYTDDELGKLLSEYILGSYSLLTGEDADEYYALAWLLALDWCEEKDYVFKITKATKTEVEVHVTPQKDMNSNGEREWQEEKEKNLDTYKKISGKYVKEYKRENYLSEMGIWVKKSSISYIF